MGVLVPVDGARDANSSSSNSTEPVYDDGEMNGLQIMGRDSPLSGAWDLEALSF
jgi:hypothetical protein